ncbi:hypothetical protein [Streptomyces sp. NPDC054783]
MSTGARDIEAALIAARHRLPGCDIGRMTDWWAAGRAAAGRLGGGRTRSTRASPSRPTSAASPGGRALSTRSPATLPPGTGTVTVPDHLPALLRRL